MLRCLELASNGICSVAPNPMVGSLIVKDGRIIGEGYHQKFGEAHAEVNAINSVENKEWLKNSTLYVNLEPCGHFGKTPPCAELIRQMGIPRVVIGSTDPNPLVNGKGIKLLQQSGCEVTTGVLEKEANELNHRFIHFHKKSRPFFILKWAETEDGFIDKFRKPGELIQPNWITDDICRMLVHRWRTEEQAVMVGTNTALLDNPQLNSRFWPGNQPIKLILDRELRIPDNFNLYKPSAPLFIFNSRINKDEELIHYHKTDFGSLFDELIYFLNNKGIQSVMIEGGSKLIQSFIEREIWDEARIFTGPVVFGKGLKAPIISGKAIFNDRISNSRLRILRPSPDS